MTEIPTSSAVSTPIVVPTIIYDDVFPVLLALANTEIPRIDVVIGLSDTGKSALLRRLASAYRMAGEQVRFVDLSLSDWRSELLGSIRTDVVVVDHLDRMVADEPFKGSFLLVDRVLPALLPTGAAD